MSSGYHIEQMGGLGQNEEAHKFANTKTVPESFVIFTEDPGHRERENLMQCFERGQAS